MTAGATAVSEALKKNTDLKALDLCCELMNDHHWLKTFIELKTRLFREQYERSRSNSTL